MIVWMVSYPRSGNTLFRTLLYHYCGVHTYSMSADPEFFHSKFHNAVGHMGWPPYGNNGTSIEILVNSPIVYFIKTHATRPENLAAEGRVIHIVRDGRDTVVSQCRRRSRPLSVAYPEELWDRVTHDYWQSFVMAWRDEADVHARFEDMLTDGIDVVHSVVGELGLCLPFFEDARIPTFKQLHDKSGTFFRRGIVGSHRDEMPSEMQRVFMQHNGEAMEAYGYC